MLLKLLLRDRRAYVCTLILSFAVHGLAQDWEAKARRLRPADLSSSENAVINNLSARVKSTLSSITRATDRGEADAARPGLRVELQNSLGYKRLPWPPDLQPHVTSVLRQDGYRIEKIVYQGLPGEWIPAHLYMPAKIEGRIPAIVFYDGHWFSDGKSRTDFQAFCINMARLGFIVLNFDTYGQGERGLSWRDHRRDAGLLVGIAQQGFAEYDTQCALQYLLSRPDVDPKRIGITGASGGGFNTWITAAIDDRIAAAVSVVGTCDFYEQTVTRIARDWDPSDQCHYVPGLFRYANNHELLTMTAPKPILIVSATADRSFPIAGARSVYEYGQKLYQSYGIPDRIGFYEDSSAGHGYQIKKREAAYGWFLRWLMDKGDGRPVAEPPTSTLPPDAPELRCFPPGKNQAAGPAMIAAVQEDARHLPPEPPRIRLTDVLGPWPSPIAWKPKIGSQQIQRLVIPSEPGLNVPVILAQPTQHVRGIVLALDDRGKESVFADSAIRDALNAGWAVLAVDPRGIGELATSKPTWTFAISLLQGENMVWRQTLDSVRAIQAVMSVPRLSVQPVGLYARGTDSALAATYLLGWSAQQKNLKLKWFLLRDGFLSYRSFLDRPKSMRLSYQLWTSESERAKPLDHEIPAIYFAFNALNHFDLPDLVAAPHIPGLVVNPINGDWNRMAEAEARKLISGDSQLVTGDATEPAIQHFLEKEFVEERGAALSTSSPIR
jgi:dienelactone hydrolase